MGPWELWRKHIFHLLQITVEVLPEPAWNIHYVQLDLSDECVVHCVDDISRSCWCGVRSGRLSEEHKQNTSPVSTDHWAIWYWSSLAQEAQGVQKREYDLHIHVDMIEDLRFFEFGSDEVCIEEISVGEACVW